MTPLHIYYASLVATEAHFFRHKLLRIITPNNKITKYPAQLTQGNLIIQGFVSLNTKVQPTEIKNKLRSLLIRPKFVFSLFVKI